VIKDSMSSNRVISIDILKFFAVIFITHSHMDIIYGPYKFLCTGGAIGDALFFFISGYTLFIGRNASFDNWYKRRICRIYPTIFSWALISCVLFGNQNNFVQTILCGGGGFVSCILLCYIPLYLIKRYLIKRLQFVMFFSVILILFIFFNYCEDKSHMYASNNIMWPVWCFSMMLFGAIVGHRRNQSIVRKEKGKFKNEIIKLFISVLLYYVILYMSLRRDFEYIAFLGVFPLYFIVYYFYRLTNSPFILRLYRQPIINCIVYCCGALCLEVYLVQPSLYSERWNYYFPLNIIVYWIVIFVFAYILKVFSNVFRQTFKDDNYTWKEIINLYHK